MNKDISKTLLLAFLVITSIYFSKSLWDSTLPTNIDTRKVTKTDINNKNYELLDVIIPHKIVVNFNENNTTVLYSNDKHDIWNEGKSALNSIFNDKNLLKSHINKEDYNHLHNIRHINFEFSEELYTHMIGKILEIDIPEEIYNDVRTINNIYFSLGQEPFIVLGNNSKSLKIKSDSLNLTQLNKIMYAIENTQYTKFYRLEEVLGSKSNVYIPVKTRHTIPSIYISKRYSIDNMIISNDNIAELFFEKRIEYIRKIEENNGSSIYIDGENILKIYTDGRLEYIGPIEYTNQTDLYSSIKQAVEFVTGHMGWPDNVYLSSIQNKKSERENLKGYKFTFRYTLNGLTVISNREDIQDKIEVEVINGSVTSYKSKIWNNMGIYSIKNSSTPIKSAFEIIDDNFLFLKDEYIKHNREDIINTNINDRLKDSITDIYLSYYGYLTGDQEVLKPVWVIEILGRKYLFDAYSGQVRN